MCEVQGLFKARRMSLNSPTFRDIEPDPSASVNEADIVFHLFNDAEGNAASSNLVIKGGVIALYGFILDGATGDAEGKRFERDITFSQDTRKQELASRFIFSFDKPIISPPDWSRFR